jgi:hypothetical protein
MYEPDYQSRVVAWANECLGEEDLQNKEMRVHRFLEEAFELCQSCGLAKERVAVIANYVFNREVGKRTQEVGGVLVTLATLCEAFALDMEICGELELERILNKIPQIRERHKAKPSFQ